MEQLERRSIGRVSFPSKGVLVVCDTQEVLHVGVRDLGPIGVGIRAEADTPNLVGKDVIMVAETLIMYANADLEAKLTDKTNKEAEATTVKMAADEKADALTEAENVKNQAAQAAQAAQDNVNKATNKLAEAEKKVKEAEADVNTAAADVKEKQELVVLAEKGLEQLEADVKTAKEKLTAANTGLEKANADAQKAADEKARAENALIEANQNVTDTINAKEQAEGDAEAKKAAAEDAAKNAVGAQETLDRAKELDERAKNSDALYQAAIDEAESLSAWRKFEKRTAYTVDVARTMLEEDGGYANIDWQHAQANFGFLEGSWDSAKHYVAIKCTDRDGNPTTQYFDFRTDNDKGQRTERSGNGSGRWYGASRKGRQGCAGQGHRPAEGCRSA